MSFFNIRVGCLARAHAVQEIPRVLGCQVSVFSFDYDRFHAGRPILELSTAFGHDLDGSIGQVSRHIAEIGGRVNRLEQAGNRLEDTKLTLETLVSEEEDLDLIQAASELTYYETALEASILSTQRIFQTLGIL